MKSEKTMWTKELTPTETWLLTVIYKLGDADTHEILEYISEEKDWKYTGLESLLIQLFDKEYLTRYKSGRRYRYKPVYPFTNIVKRVVNRLFGKFLNEHPYPLVDYLFELKELNEKDQKAVLEMLNVEEEKNLGADEGEVKE